MKAAEIDVLTWACAGEPLGRRDEVTDDEALMLAGACAEVEAGIRC